MCHLSIVILPMIGSCYRKAKLPIVTINHCPLRFFGMLTVCLVPSFDKNTYLFLVTSIRYSRHRERDERETETGKREREKERGTVCDIYIYIYIYLCVCINRLLDPNMSIHNIVSDMNPCPCLDPTLPREAMVDVRD